MILENDKYHIEIMVDHADVFDSKKYDMILNPAQWPHNELSRPLAIDINLLMRHLKIALIGSSYTNDSHCAVLEDDILTVLQDDMITQIRVTDGAIIKNVILDCCGTNFAIYKVRQGYLIHGELEITMLDSNFQRKWEFSGRDIFATISDKEAFAIKDEKICLYDFQDYYYELDFEGKEITSNTSTAE